MERRLILVIALSLLVLLSWSALVSKLYHIDNQRVTVRPAVAPPPIIQEQKISPSSLLTVYDEKFDLIFNEPQAAIKEIIFKDYPSSQLVLQNGFWIEDNKLVFKKEDSLSKEETKFVYRDQNQEIIKRFIVSNSNYNIELEIAVTNLSPAPININLPLALGVLNFAGNQIEARYQDVTVAIKEKTLHLNARKDMAFEEAQFLGLRNQYFTAIIEPVSGNYSALIKTLGPQESLITLQTKEFLLSAGQQMQQKFRIYLGPQDLKIINQINPDWSVVMYYGTFNFFSHLLLQGLEVLYRLVHNWGGAIIILSVLIYILVYPLTLKQMRSMKEMQALQPHIEELRKAYKDNPQKLNKEIMELYRQHKVNPFGGCLPLILQIPVFFALYQALMRSVALKGAKFLWIKDLSGPDRLFILPTSLPILGNEINILPIIMAIGMFFQQKLSMSATTSSSAEQQKLMTVLFPIMFGFIFYKMPSGLVLYWFINSSLMLLYQLRIRRAK